MNSSTIKRIFSNEEIGALNDRYRKLSQEKRITELYKDFEMDEIMLTSSFAATSALLLKLFSDTNNKQLVYFIDTGFHFKETLIYKEYLTQLYDLNVENIQAEKFKHEFTVKDETWKKDPNYCCTLNKVEPISALKETHTLWVSGLMSWQSDHRNSLDIFEQRNGILKFYPLLDLTRDERESFIHDHHLPFHPLISKGYLSIGCSNCTSLGKGRDGRWNNNPKTECGLHL